MNTTQPNLNLARKWRPESFDQVIGQDIAVRMLKNSLYVNKYFPVYLFAGQRGCGKTTSARIFAAAVNCKGLVDFQKNPTLPIPCLTCSSCITMGQGDHPDFIEIDAASHTGVDNVRQIIESSSYMPLVGQKKVYLIDEAHMLSKAAFNAFLKVLEEPPLSVIFLLATTEVPKLPTTVLSRCFQLTFSAIDTPSLKEHLKQICAKEQVVIDDEALAILVEETEGSARDAINLLERVRFSSDHITQETILRVLGKIGLTDLIATLDLVMTNNAAGLVQHLQSISFEQRSADLLWDSLIQAFRLLVWLKFGVQALPASVEKNRDELQKLADTCSLNRLQAILNLLWSQEEIFSRTSKKHVFLEMTLLTLCQQVNIADLDELLKAHGPASAQGYGGAGCGGFSSMPQHPIQARQVVSQPLPPSIRSLHSAQGSRPSLDKLGTSGINIPTALSELRRVEGSGRTDTGQAFLTEQQSTPIAQPTLNNVNTQSPQQITPKPTSVAPPVQHDSRWAGFLSGLSDLQDQLLLSILSQSTFVTHNQTSCLVTIQLSTDSIFLKNTITDSRPLWLPSLQAHFIGANGFAFEKGTAQAAVKAYPLPAGNGKIPTSSPPPMQAAKPFQRPVGNSFKPPQEAVSEFITIKDLGQWPKAGLLLRHFPGKIKKLKAHP